MDLYAASEKEGLLIDLGTNGELALSHQGKWFVSSAACGPAFEGGNMACGSPAVNGAIDKVWYDKTWHWHTISSAPAQSVCGSGYISWIAGALDQDLLEESGYLSEEIELLPGIYLARQDIRSFQMAKGALAAAIETLCSYARMRVSEIERIVIAGGFGQHSILHIYVSLAFFRPVFRERLSVWATGHCREQPDMPSCRITKRSKNSSIGLSRSFLPSSPCLWNVSPRICG